MNIENSSELVDNPSFGPFIPEQVRKPEDQSSCNLTQPSVSEARPNISGSAPTVTGIIPKVHNIVCSVFLGCELDLLKIALRLRNAEYNPKRFHGVIMRILDPKTACIIFRNGRIIVTGAKNESAAHLAARKYARLIQKLGFNVTFVDFKIQNMVATCDVKFPIQIEHLYTAHCQFTSYEPEIFPGLIYRMVKPKVVLLIFVSGKLVLTGGKSRDELKEAFENIYPTLKTFRKL